MSKNTKKPGADIPSDPRNKNLNAQVSLGNKGKARRMPPPATLLTAPKKESASETPQTPNKHWGSTGTPSTPEKPDWVQLSSSLPPSARTAVSNAEFPSLSGGREEPRNIPSQREKIYSPSPSERLPKKPQEGASSQRSYNPSYDGSKYHQQRSEGQSEHRYGAGPRPSSYFNQRSNQTNSRNNSYSNRQGQVDRNRGGYSRQHPSYDRDKSVPEMFADSEASNAPHVRSLPIRHANFENDMDAKGWAGKQDTVDYSEKIKFDSSGDEADPERVPLKRIAPPREATVRVPNKGQQTDPHLHKERPGIHQFPEYRTGSPESQHPSGASIQSPVRPGKPTQIMKRPTSESAEQTHIEAPPPERPAEYKTHSPQEEPFQQPQKMSMRQTVPTIPSQSVRVSEPTKQPENTSQSVPVSTARESAWNQEKQPSAPKPQSKLPTKGTETQPPTNVWERRKQNEPSEPQRQGLQEFPKLGDNDPVQSCVIVPTKMADKQEALRGGGGGRTHDDDVFAQDKGSYHPRQGSWEPRRDRERRRSDEKRSYGRQGSQSGRYPNESDKSQNWRTEGGETEDRSRFGDREDEKEDRFRKNERSNAGERERREDRRSSSRGYQRREYQDREWEERGTSGGSRGRFQGRQDDRDGDYWRGEKGSFRDNERRSFQDNDRGQIRDSDRRQFRDHDKRQFRDNDRRQFREDDRGQYRNSERGRYNGGRFRDDDRGDKYVGKSSSEGRTSNQWVRSGPPPSNSNGSYANAVSNRGDTEEDEVTAGQEGGRPDPPLPSEGDRMRPDSQDSWRQPRPGHMKYTQQRKFQPTRAEVSESESRASPLPQQSDSPVRDSMTEWTDVNVEPRRGEGEPASSISPSEAGFIEIRKNRNKGRGVSYAETEGPRALGRGRGRIQDDNNGIPGSRSMGPPGKTSSTADARFSRGVSPQKSQGLGRARMSERTNHVSPKRSTQRSTDYDKKPGQLPRADSPPPASQKLSSSNSSSISNYVQPGLSFSAIASKNIEKTPLPPPPHTPTKATTQPAEEKDVEKPTSCNDETTPNKESDTARGKHSISKVSSADSLSPDQSIELAGERSDKEDHLSDENDEVQEVVSTTIVNSYMKEEVDEIDKTPHAHLIAHSEHKEETEGVLDPSDAEEPGWGLHAQDRTPTPQKQIEKSTETAPTRPVLVPVPSKLEERPRSNTPIQASQPAPAPISVVEHKKPDVPMPTTSNVFPDASPQTMLQSGFNSEWFNTTTMPSLGDIPPHLPFQYPIQQPMTDDDKVVRSKQSDLSDYVNAPEFLPSLPPTLSPYAPDTLYPASLASANFGNPNYPPDFSQQTLIQSIQPSLDATTTAGGLLTAPRINPGSYPSSQYSISSLYPSSQMMPGGIAAGQMRATPHQNMLRQFTPHPMHASQNLNAFTGYNLAQGNMRAAVMNTDKNRRNDKMGPMVDKVPNPHAMYYNNYPRKWDANTQYNGAMRKNTPTPFTPLVPQNIRNYNPNHRGNYRPPKKSNPSNNPSYMKSYAQPTMAIPPTIHNPQYRANQSFISLVGPVRPPQQPQHVNQLRNPNNQFRGKNMQMNYYAPRQQMQYPGGSLYILPQNTRGPQTGPQITSGITPSIESSIAPQALNYQVQIEGDMSKSNLVGPQFNMQVQDQIPSSQKFRPFPSDNSREDSVASEYSKIGPVAVNGRVNNDLSDKMHSENSIFVPQVPNLLSSDPLQQGAPSDLIMKSHVDVSSASPQSAMDIYGPEPLVTSSTLASSSSETLVQVQSYQSEEKLSLPPTESQQDDQTQPQVNLDS